MSLAETVRAGGKRLTLQRRLVLEAVQHARHHVTADDIVARVRRTHPQIDPSTVYRNLVALEELGLVTHTHLDDRVTRWHRADIHPHGHLVCRGCGRETEIAPAVLEALADRLQREYQFSADLAHSAVVGTCRRCRAASR